MVTSQKLHLLSTDCLVANMLGTVGCSQLPVKGITVCLDNALSSIFWTCCKGEHLIFNQDSQNYFGWFSSVAQSCPTLRDPMNRSTPGLPVPHQFPEFTQTHVHRVSDAIQPSHPLSSPSPSAPNPSQHQSLFQ